MTDLDLLVEAGAKAMHERDNPRALLDWELFSDEWKDGYRTRSRAHLTAILPLLADDLAGVCNRLSRPVGGGDGSTYTCGTSFDAAQAIRTRISALIGESQ